MALSSIIAARGLKNPILSRMANQGGSAVAEENKVKLSKIAKSIRGFTIKTAVGIIIVMPSLAMAEPFNRDKAQSDMLLRFTRSTSAFASQIGLPNFYITYCYTKLNLSTKNQPADGSIPYGVNYNTASDETVRQTLSAREAYETGYVMVCLAEAKNAIFAASKQE
jgi:hypothetical protein